MTQMTCPDPGTLAAYAQGRLPRSARSELEDHVSSCLPCRASVAAALELFSGSHTERARRRLAPAFKWAAAAACLLALGIGGGAWAWRNRDTGQSPSSPDIAEGRFRFTAGKSGALPPDETLRLPDGTLLRSGPWASARFLDPGPGERCHVQLDRGELAATVAKERGGFRVSTPAGEIRVLGTRFRARAFRIRLPSGPADVLYVNLEEGKVSVENVRGSLQLLHSAVALAIVGMPPMQLEGASDLVSSLKALGTIVERGEEGGLKIVSGKEHSARILAGSLWGEWGPALLSKAGDPAERAGALAAAVLCASREELTDALRVHESALNDEERRVLQGCQAARAKEASR